MSTLRLSLVAATVLVGSSTFAWAEPDVRLHDAAKPVVHTAQVVGREAPGVGVHHVRPTVVASKATGIQRVAILDRSLACDSLLCPGYTMMGVGF